MNTDIIESIKQHANTTPYWNLLGMQVVDAREGWAKCSMPIEPKHLLKRGNVHGGAIASLADSVVAIALLPMIDREHFITTVELKINYLAPINHGDIMAEAQIIHKGSRLAVGDVDLYNNGKLVAKCIATYIILKRNDSETR